MYISYIHTHIYIYNTLIYYIYRPWSWEGIHLSWWAQGALPEEAQWRAPASVCWGLWGLHGGWQGGTTGPQASHQPMSLSCDASLSGQSAQVVETGRSWPRNLDEGWQLLGTFAAIPPSQQPRQTLLIDHCIQSPQARQPGRPFWRMRVPASSTEERAPRGQHQLIARSLCQKGTAQVSTPGCGQGSPRILAEDATDCPAPTSRPFRPEQNSRTHNHEFGGAGRLSWNAL